MKDFNLDPPEDDERLDDFINERIDAMMNDEAWLVGVVVDDDDIYQAVLMIATQRANEEAERERDKLPPWKGSSSLTSHYAQLGGAPEGDDYV